jgi:hypothetical protein
MQHRQDFVGTIPKSDEIVDGSQIYRFSCETDKSGAAVAVYHQMQDLVTSGRESSQRTIKKVYG